MSSKNFDVEHVQTLLAKQNEWRRRCINLIASENVMSKTAESAYVSDFMHRYAEGDPHKRYYNGTKYIDEIEEWTSSEMAKLLGTRYIDVRPLSGTIANLSVFSTITKPGDTIVSLSTPSGGHISHNKYGAPTALGRYVVNYKFDAESINIDVDGTAKMLRENNIQPKLFVSGASLFLFPHPLKELRELADEFSAYLMYDAAHVLGLITAREFQDPAGDGVDVITSSTHKTFPGPQGGIVSSNNEDIFLKVKKGVFPMMTSNHHLHRLPPLAVTIMEMGKYGKDYARSILENAQTLAQHMYELGLPVIGEEMDFTKSHQIALNVSKIGLTGGEAADLAEEADIILNKNLLPGEPLKHAMNPSGIRIGVQEMTRFGMGKSEMGQIAEMLKRLWVGKVDPGTIQKEVNDLRGEFQFIHFSFDN